MPQRRKQLKDGAIAVAPGGAEEPVSPAGLPRKDGSWLGIRPLHNNLLVQRIDGPGEWKIAKVWHDNKLVDAIIIPDAHKKKPLWAVVYAVGPDAMEEFKQGDVVLMQVWGGTELKINDVPFLSIKPKHVLCVLDE